MATQGSVTRWVQDLRSGDRSERNRAAQLIWERYFPDLLERARNHLNSKIRTRQDEQDVLQNMYMSFCLRQQRGDYELASRDALWKLLVTITLNQARNVATAEGRLKRAVAGEHAAVRDELEQMDAGAPSPLEVAILNEALECRLHSLQDPELRQIALWRLEGYTVVEIADKLGLVERTIQRRVGLIRRKFESFDDSAS